MSTIIFIKPANYNQSLVGEQLVSILDKSVYVDGRWCCYSTPRIDDELSLTITQDSLIHMITNFMLARRYEHIIVSYPYEDDELIFELLRHLQTGNRQVTIFHFTDTSALAGIDNMELLNSEYESEYLMLDNGEMVKLSYVDTTDMSAFKIAKVLEAVILR